MRVAEVVGYRVVLWRGGVDSSFPFALALPIRGDIVIPTPCSAIPPMSKLPRIIGEVERAPSTRLLAAIQQRARAPRRPQPDQIRLHTLTLAQLKCTGTSQPSRFRTDDPSIRCRGSLPDYDISVFLPH